MQRIFFIRHGQTDYNLQNRVQGGGIDAPLNANGIAQSQRFADVYRDVPFTAIIHTSLRRTRETVSPVSVPSAARMEVPELNEMNWGILEGMEASDELREEFRRINAEWTRGNLHLSVERGETPLAVWERTRAGLDRIFSQFPEGDILICTHGRLLRILLSEVLGYGMQNMNLFTHENTGLNLLYRTPNGKFFASKLNDISHLAS